MDANLLTDIQAWHDGDEHQKIIDAITALPGSEIGYELTGLLARAYNNRGEDEDYAKAIELLKSVADEGLSDPVWHYRLGYAYYYLDQELSAIREFEAALKLNPDDEDSVDFIKSCRESLSLPVTIKPFTERVEEFWKLFLLKEEELRGLIDARSDAELITGFVDTLLKTAFHEIYFELGYNGTHYELILTSEGDRGRLYEMVYWKSRVPEELLSRWNFILGRNPAPGMTLQIYGVSLTAAEVLVWPEPEEEDKKAGLTLYSEKLAKLAAENENAAYRAAEVLLDQTLGEIASMRYVSSLDLAAAPDEKESPLTLDALPDYIKNTLDPDNAERYSDPDSLLKSYTAYQHTPEEDGWYPRADVFVGNTSFPDLISGYYEEDDTVMEACHSNGTIACFLYYPNGAVPQENMVGFRADMEDAITEQMDGKAVVLGGATGKSYSYIDCICYDLRAFLDAVSDMAENWPVEALYFHVFRKNYTGAVIKNTEEEPEEGTILTKRAIRQIEELADDGRMYDALEYIRDYIEQGTEDGSFTEEEAYHDLKTALYVAYANNNIDDYEHYISTEKWLKRVEDLAGGNGTWYYRYASSLIYLGRLNEALDYTVKGVAEEPNYPWGYLNLGKLKSHFGDKEGALLAVEKGLSLVPDDYEFRRLRTEIEEGRNLEEMENHYIEEEADQQLNSSSETDPDRKNKQEAVSGILCREENLSALLSCLHASEWKPDTPYCLFTISHPEGIGGRLSAEFHMNRASASKFDLEWTETFYNRLSALRQTAGEWLEEQTRGKTLGSRLLLSSVTFTWFHRFTLELKDSETGLVYPVCFTDEFDPDPRRQENFYPELYEQDELTVVEGHIEANFGAITNVLHEIVSPDIHVDVYVIAPTEERAYYTLVTCGMGAHRMNVPDKVNAAQWGRAEVLITLPPEWDFTSREETSYWPIRCLKSLARLPGENDTWLCSTHTVSYGSPLAENNWFTGVLLLNPQAVEENANYCTLPNGDDVNFYQVIPLYEEEMKYKLEHGFDELLEQMADVKHVVDVDRPNVRIMDIEAFLQ